MTVEFFGDMSDDVGEDDINSLQASSDILDMVV